MKHGTWYQNDQDNVKKQSTVNSAIHTITMKIYVAIHESTRRIILVFVSSREKSNFRILET